MDEKSTSTDVILYLLIEALDGISKTDLMLLAEKAVWNIRAFENQIARLDASDDGYDKQSEILLLRRREATCLVHLVDSLIEAQVHVGMRREVRAMLKSSTKSEDAGDS